MMNFFVAKAFAAALTINPDLPGSSSSSIGSFISGFYTFALIISGILAFGAIVYGGIKYATGRGNPTAESDGRSWITSALLGLLLLAGAYVILYTINPNILNLQNPVLPGLAPPAPSSKSGSTGSQSVICPGSQTLCSPPMACHQSTARGVQPGYEICE
jgi:Type IV secretion system pilin